MGIANCGTYVSIQLQLPWLIHPYLCVQVQHPQNKFKWGRASSIQSVSGPAIYTCLPMLIWFNLHSSPIRIHRFRDPERTRKHLHILRRMSTPKSRENKHSKTFPVVTILQFYEDPAEWSRGRCPQDISIAPWPHPRPSIVIWQDSYWAGPKTAL